MTRSESSTIEAASREFLGTLPPDVARLVAESRHLDALVELANLICGEDQIEAWRIELTSKGPPYQVALFLHREREFRGKSIHTLTDAFVDALRRAVRDRTLTHSPT